MKKKMSKWKQKRAKNLKAKKILVNYFVISIIIFILGLSVFFYFRFFYSNKNVSASVEYNLDMESEINLKKQFFNVIKYVPISKIDFAELEQ